jgi:hypothetical protein
VKTIFFLACTFILIDAPTAGAQRLTTDDPNFSSLSQLADSIGWYQVTGTKAWSVGDADADGRNPAPCTVTLNKLRAAGVPDTRTVDVRWESPELKPGIHTLAEIRTSCEHVERIGKIKDFEKWAILAMQAGTNVRSGSDYYRLCLQTYDRIVKAGISPNERVPDRVIGSAQWSGTIGELRKKWCESGMTMATEKAASREAPYRQELKSDKLKIALTYGSVFVPGGVGTSDAHKMANASVWFLDLSPPKHCIDGRQVHTIRRYQFASDQHLVKTTSKDYCGGAPRSAFQ